MPKRYDVIVIRYPAPAALRLLKRLPPFSGKRILILERGDYLPREGSELERAGRLRRRPDTRPRRHG